MTPTISIFVSCYNEHESIIYTLQTVITSLTKSNLNWEILVIDDCSSDNSVAVIKQFIENNNKLPIFLHVHKHNSGLDKCIFEAAQLLKGKYFWCVAGDNPLSEETCSLLLAQVGKADLIIPYVKEYVGKSQMRCAISWLYAFLVRFISGCPVRYYNGSSIFLREHFIKQIEKVKGYTYSAEIIINLLNEGCHYLEVPVIYKDRVHGKSTALTYSNLIDAAFFFWRLIRKRLSF